MTTWTIISFLTGFFIAGLTAYFIFNSKRRKRKDVFNAYCNALTRQNYKRSFDRGGYVSDQELEDKMEAIAKDIESRVKALAKQRNDAMTSNVSIGDGWKKIAFELQLRYALENEDYERAAELRDQLKELNEEI